MNILETLVQVSTPLIYQGIVFLIGLGGFYLLNNLNTNKTLLTFWQTLAQSNHLKFARNSAGALVHGNYRGYSLKLNTVLDTKKPFIRLSVSLDSKTDYLLPKNLAALQRQVTAQDIALLLKSTQFSSGELANGKLVAEPKGRTLYYYEQYSLDEGQQYLQTLFDVLSDLGDGYLRVLALGGEAVPLLQDILHAPRHPLKEVATQLLSDIGEETSTRLAERAAHLFCVRCLTRCAAHKVNLGLQSLPVSYYGCRVCSQSRKFVAGSLVVVLDNQIETPGFKQNGVWRVNWLARRALFDFDEVHIVQATDEDVERFAVQVGNDTDPVRQPRYQGMRCLVSPDCRLSENTHRILARTFGQVVTESLNESQVV